MSHPPRLGTETGATGFEQSHRFASPLCDKLRPDGVITRPAWATLPLPADEAAAQLLYPRINNQKGETVAPIQTLPEWSSRKEAGRSVTPPLGYSED
jgi:hypothetical protein